MKNTDEKNKITLRELAARGEALDVKEASRYAKRHEKTVKEWIRNGWLYATRPGARSPRARGGGPWRIQAATLERYLNFHGANQ